MPNWETDDECTAAPGLMGTNWCHMYPGCGCGGLNAEDYSAQETKEGSTALYSPVLYSPPPKKKWFSIKPDSCKFVPVGGGLEISWRNKSFLLTKEVKHKIISDKEVVLLRKDVEKWGTLKSIFKEV